MVGYDSPTNLIREDGDGRYHHMDDHEHDQPVEPGRAATVWLQHQEIRNPQRPPLSGIICTLFTM